MKTTIKILLCICIIMIGHLAFGDENHFINIFIGDRAAGLGGAYTAIADGPEGVYYNPAGLSFSSSRYFSLSVNAVQFKMLRYKDVFYHTDTDFDYSRYSFSFIPNFFGFIQKQKHFVFAVTVACLDSEFYDQRDNAQIQWRPVDASGDTLIYDYDFNINFNYVDMIYEVGASFSFLPHERVSIGFGLYASYRDKKLIYQILYDYDKYDVFEMPTSLFSNDRLIGLKPQLGIQVMPIDQLSIGYSISFPFNLVNISNVQSTNFSQFDTTFNKTVNDNEFTVYNIFHNGFFTPAYIKQSLGIAAFLTKSVLISLDGHLYIPLQNVDASGNLRRVEYNDETNAYEYYQLSNNYKLNIIGNVAFGVEWYITPNFPLRAGFFTNFTNTQPILTDDSDKSDFYFSTETKNYFTEENMNMNDYVHLLGGSFSLGYSTSSLGINIGVTVSGGVGEAQLIAGSRNVQRLEAITVNAFISGGYQF